MDGVLTAYERIEGDSVSYTGEFQERDQAGTCSGSFEIRELKQYNWQLKRTYKGGNGCEFVGDTIATDFYKVGSNGELMELPIASTGDIYVEDGDIPSGALLPEHSALPVFFENRNQSYMALAKEVGSMGQLYMVKVDLGSKGKTSVVSNCTDINMKGEQADLRVGNPSSTRDFYFSEYPSWFLRAASHFCGTLDTEELHEPREVAEASSNYLKEATLNLNLLDASYKELEGGVLEDTNSQMLIEYKRNFVCGNGRIWKTVNHLALDWETRSWNETIIWHVDCFGNELRDTDWGEGSFRSPKSDHLELDALDTDGSVVKTNTFEIYIQGSTASIATVEEQKLSRTTSSEEPSSVLPGTESSLGELGKEFPKETCGDSAFPDAQWFPVFVDNGDLESIRAEWCSDAIAKTRQDTGAPTVQLASFTDSQRARDLANLVGGEVGEPYALDD